MFNTKKQVDSHAEEVLRKARNENEKRVRCFALAKLYFKIREYEAAKHFNSIFLIEKESSPVAHRLQGQIYENLGDKQRALISYRTSLEYDAEQPDLVLKMCELLCESDVTLDTDRAHYWCERASDLFPHEPRVFRLREKLLNAGGNANSSDFESLINSELKSRPKDVSVRTRLMRLYMETGRTVAAFNHATEVEAQQTFRDQLPWYECFAQVCQAYSEDSLTNHDWVFYTTWLTVLDRTVSLSMAEHPATKSIAECAQFIFSMDQVLFKTTSVKVSRENQELFKQFQRHMSAQLCLHLATLMMKKAKKEPSQWRDVVRLASPLLFFCLSPAPDAGAPYALNLRPPMKQMFSRWVADASYRSSQAVYTLLPLARDSGENFVKKIVHMNAGNWRERIFQREFTSAEQRRAISTSFFLTTELLAKISPHLPSPLQHDSIGNLVGVYECVRGSLHHLAWLGLQVASFNSGNIPPQFHTRSVSRLKLTTPDLSNVSPETLTVLDVDAFLYATVLCARASLDVEITSGFYTSDRPITLPTDIANLLCNQEQIKWWSMAHQVNSQQFMAGGDLMALRQQLQRGLEVIRANGNHGLHVCLLVNLARTFANRASFVKSRTEQAALEARASLFWNAALPILLRVERGQSTVSSDSKLFQYPSKEVSVADAGRMLDEGRYYEACQLMKAEHYNQAIEAFKPLRSPHASFQQALIYKKLANAELEERPREEITSEMRSKHVILLTKAREYLNVTWQRIKNDRRHELHASVTQESAEVEAALSRIEPDPSPAGRSDEVVLTSPSHSSAGSLAAGDYRKHSTPRINGHGSTPRRHFYSEIGRQKGDITEMFGQLIQIQNLQKDVKAINDKLDLLVESVEEIKRSVALKPARVADDLYNVFGDEEEYPEDILNTPQYQTPFVPTFPTPQPAVSPYFPPAARGVQGTSTVTYGAPPAPPVLPLLPCYQPPQNLFYNTPGMPFTDPNQLPDFLRQNIPKPIVTQPLPPPPPVNVVITTSDTLPSGPPPMLPTLSVTIPPQHRLGTVPSVQVPPQNPSAAAATPPHQFQIQMPATATTPTFEKSPVAVPEEVDSEEDNDAGYDPCPNFRPIVPLPNEVCVKTGEEDDDILFENRAKLFRFVDKEWKERGIGVVKILKNKTNDKVRLVMRREQVHKICANHLIQSSMELTWMKNSDKALIWVAQDFAEEVVQVEKFCIKFKLPEEAERFKDAFNDAKEKYGQSPQKPKAVEEEKTPAKSPTVVDKPAQSTDTTEKVKVGGFTFTSPPKLKEQEEAKPSVDVKKDLQPPAASPFAAFSFTPQKPSSATAKSLFANLSTDQVSKKPEANAAPFSSGSLFGNVSSQFDSKNATQQPLAKPSDTADKSLFSFTLPASSGKETPKSILKEPVVNSVSSTKSSPAAKHVIFKEETPNETPTLTALLTSPRSQVVDFSYLSKMGNGGQPGFASKENSTASSFAGAGTPVFGGAPTRTRTDSEGENVEEFVPTAEFKPVISLPDLVDVKTGEEGQEVLFDERAKLMRFDPDNKEWKERGIGQMKILKDPTTAATRFLMRREQVLKVCCNHRIIPSLELRQAPSSEKALTWFAVDHSEAEPKNELFAIRFKTLDLAKLFKEVVDNVQKQMREEGTAKRSCPDSSAQDEVAKEETTPKATSGADSLPKLSEMFRPKAGSWECKACYTVNGAKDSACVSCDSPKEKPKSPAPVPAAATPPSTQPSLAELFKPKAGSWECQGCFCRNDGEKTVCPACNTAKPGHESDAKEAPKNVLGSTTFSFGVNPSENKAAGFSFGTQPAATTPFSFGIGPIIPIKTSEEKQAVPSGDSAPANDSKTAAPVSFSFGLAKTESPFTFTPKKEAAAADSSSGPQEKAGAAFKFGDGAAQPSFVFGTPKPDGFAFGSAGKFEFNFSGVRSARSPSKSPRSPQGAAQDSEADSEPEEADEEEGDQIVFQPVVPLPDKVPLTTGEEEETVLYSHRAKLFRFTQGEWKERGVGDAKILRHKDTHKIRLLMRREPILKLCLNHYLTAHLNFSQKDDRSWLWCAQDFAEGTLTDEQFCIRFKSPEIAVEFKEAVDKAQGELAGEEIQPKKTNTSESTNEAEEQGVDPDELEVVYEACVSDDLREAALKLQLPPNFYSYLTAPPCPGCPGCEHDSDEGDESKITSAESDETKYPDSCGVRPPRAATIAQSNQPFTFTVPKMPSSTAALLFSGTPAPSTVQSSFSFTYTPPTTTTAQTPVGSNVTQSNSIFGGSPSFQSQTSVKSIFGGSSLTTSTNSALSLFGSASSQSSGPFSSNTPQSKNFSLFSGSSGQNTPSTPQSTSTTSVFGGSPANAFGSPTSTAGSVSSGTSFFSNLKSFDKSPQSSLFGGSVVIGSAAPGIQPTGFFNKLIEPSEEISPQTDSSDSGPTFLFKPTTTFSDIATISKNPVFGTDKTNGNFSWSGAGTPVFGGEKPVTPRKDEGSDGEEDDEGEGENDQHDPQFAPIVPLPDAIEVRTGEEDEEKEFCYRAKFFRYDSDNKEWKERGVGEMKILRHRQTNSYRLLLRREQVHKVVCNQLITAEMELSLLSTSGNAFCWAGMNMAEEYPEPRLEKVAVRFKNSDIALEFKAKVDECKVIVAARK